MMRRNGTSSEPLAIHKVAVWRSFHNLWGNREGNPRFEREPGPSLIFKLHDQRRELGVFNEAHLPDNLPSKKGYSISLYLYIRSSHFCGARHDSIALHHQESV